MLLQPEYGINEQGANAALSSTDARKRKPLHYAVENNHHHIASAHLQYDDYDAYTNVHPDAEGADPRTMPQSEEMKAVFANHRKNNPVSHAISAEAFAEAFKDGLLHLEGKAAEDYRKAELASMHIRQLPEIYSAAEGKKIPNPTYREAIHVKRLAAQKTTNEKQGGIV